MLFDRPVSGLGTELLDVRGHADGFDFRQLQPALVTPVGEVPEKQQRVECRFQEANNEGGKLIARIAFHQPLTPELYSDVH